jgi:hypothetical protein
VPNARLEITVPPSGPPVAIPTARGAVRWEAIPSRWTADLGPAERLAVRWQEASAASSDTVDVQLLKWMRIEQGCVLLDVRLKPRISFSEARHLQLRIDGSLELLPDPAAAVQPTVTRGSDGVQTIDCQLQRTAGSTLDLHFLCTAASSAGVFRAPQIEVVGARPGGRQWLAISVDRSLEYQLRGVRTAEAGTAEDFMRNWGTNESPPDLAFRLNGNSTDWSMTTRLRKAETSCDQTSSWSFDSEETQVRYVAQLSTTGDSNFQYHLDVPPALHIDSLTVNAQGQEIPSRYVENKDGHLTVFLDGAATGKHQLQLRGRLSIPRDRNYVLPQFRLENVRIQSSVVRLYRRPTVEVEVSAASSFAEIKSPTEPKGSAELGQPLRAFYANLAKSSAMTVSIKSLRLPPPPGTASEVSPTVSATQLSSSTARVAAAKISYFVEPDGRRIGAAALNVESPAAGVYPLIIPDGFQLLRLAVDGLPVDVTPEQSRDSSVPVSLHGLKSNITLLFVSKPGAPNEQLSSKSQVTFIAPRIGDLPVGRTVWQITSPRGLAPNVAEGDGNVALESASVNETGDPTAEWGQFATNAGEAVSYAWDGKVDSMTVDFREASTEHSNWRVTAALAFAIVLLIALRLRGKLADWIRRWPNSAGIVLGLAWWLLAWPSALGLAIVVAIVIRLIIIRTGRFGQTAPASSS